MESEHLFETAKFDIFGLVTTLGFAHGVQSPHM